MYLQRLHIKPFIRPYLAKLFIKFTIIAYNSSNNHPYNILNKNHIPMDFNCFVLYET